MQQQMLLGQQYICMIPFEPAIISGPMLPATATQRLSGHFGMRASVTGLTLQLMQVDFETQWSPVDETLLTPKLMQLRF